jgi:hypothetical protein
MQTKRLNIFFRLFKEKDDKCNVRMQVNTTPSFTLYNNNNSIQFTSILYYLYAESTGARPITDTVQCRYK